MDDMKLRTLIIDLAEYGNAQFQNGIESEQNEFHKAAEPYYNKARLAYANITALAAEMIVVCDRLQNIAAACSARQEA